MAASLKVANLWRVIRDVDIEAIRRSARTRFELAIAADAEADARALQALVSPGGAVTPHPWVAVGEPAAVTAREATPAAALLVSRTQALSPALDAASRSFQVRGVPVVTVLVGDLSSAPAAGERARVAAPAVDRRLIDGLGGPLVETVGPDLRLALAVQLPAFQPFVFDRIIEETAGANASFALTTGLAEVVPLLTAPLNLGDMVILTKNQLVMCYRISLAAGRDGDPRRMVAEILGVLGGGLLFRQVARQLIGLVPVVGLVPKVAIAYGGTWAIGRAMVAWATEGREITADSLRRYSREGLVRGREVADRLLKRRGTPGEPGPPARWARLKGYLPTLGRRPRPQQGV